MRTLILQASVSPSIQWHQPPGNGVRIPWNKAQECSVSCREVQSLHLPDGAVEAQRKKRGPARGANWAPLLSSANVAQSGLTRHSREVLEISQTTCFSQPVLTSHNPVYSNLLLVSHYNSRQANQLDASKPRITKETHDNKHSSIKSHSAPPIFAPQLHRFHQIPMSTSTTQFNLAQPV